MAIREGVEYSDISSLAPIRVSGFKHVFYVQKNVNYTKIRFKINACWTSYILLPFLLFLCFEMHLNPVRHCIVMNGFKLDDLVRNRASKKQRMRKVFVSMDAWNSR